MSTEATPSWFRTKIDLVAGWASLWLERLCRIVGYVVAGGFILAYVGGVIFLIAWVSVSLVRAAFDRVEHAITSTDSDLVVRNLALGTVIAVLTASWLAVRWRRTHPTWLRGGRLAAWVAVFASVWFALFVGGEAATWQPATPRATPPVAAAPTRAAASGSGMSSRVASGLGTGAGSAARSSLPAQSLPLSTAQAPRALAPPVPATVAPPTVSPTVAPTSTPSLGSAVTPSTRTVYVANTGGSGVYLRASPHLDDRLNAVPDGTPLIAIGDQIQSDGNGWFRVRRSGADDAYVPSQYVSEQPPKPTITSRAAATAAPTVTLAPVRRNAPTPAPQSAPSVASGFITIGSTTDDVVAVLGQPSSRSANFWQYGLATVMFDGGRVSGWSNADKRLKVSLPGADANPGGRFSIGSSKADVVSVQGVPSAYSANFRQYGLATVMFDGDRVSGWSNAGSLKTTLSGTGTRPKERFSVGASKSDVAAVQGVPTAYSANYWQYGLATVMFDGDQVSGWSNGSSLRVSLPGASTRPQARISVGASKSDVAAVQGVPTAYSANYWQYGLATVMFEDDHVSGWSNAGNVLKVN